jgi:hypothetical protein
MNKWASRAKVHFSEKAQEPTPISPESTLLGALGVGVGRISINDDHLLGVMGVPTPSLSEIQGVDELVAAAMLACDHFNDSESGREAMRNEVLAIPPEQWPDLIEHFHSTYRRCA